MIDGERLAAVRLVVCDVDGTLTDGAMYYGAQGEVVKRFHTRDGLGIRVLGEHGVTVVLLTAEDSPIVTARAAKLGIHHVIGCSDKSAAVRYLIAILGLQREQVMAIGDDLGDLGAFAEAGVTAAPADAVAEVQAIADYVCCQRGGHGAVREVADLVCRAIDSQRGALA